MEENEYIKERLSFYVILKEEQLKKLKKIGITKYISKLIKDDLENERIEKLGDDIILEHLNLSNEIKKEFENDPRRPYLIEQLLTEHYTNKICAINQKINDEIKQSDNTVREEYTEYIEYPEEKVEEVERQEIERQKQEEASNTNSFIKKRI